MPHAHGEIIATPDGEQPYTVMIKVGDKVLASHPVRTVAEGEAMVETILAKLREFERKPGQSDA